MSIANHPLTFSVWEMTKMCFRKMLLSIVLIVLASSGVFAQVKVDGRWRLRIEDWQWFDVANFDSDYTYAHSLLRLALTGETGRARWTAELAQAGLFDVPNAVARHLRVGWAPAVP